MREITVDQDVLDFLAAKASSPDEPLAAVLRRQLEVPPPQATLVIDDDTYAFIATRTAVIGESISDILRRELNVDTPVQPAPIPATTTVSFHIEPGTGARSWNDRSSTVLARVGDTLRIANDDDVAHRPHTSGRPFPHPPSDIPPGASADFVLATPYDPDVEGPLYDHASGPSAKFWIRVEGRG